LFTLFIVPAVYILLGADHAKERVALTSLPAS
jgi:hypothetical protein